jgi:hypothetical protein
VTQQFGEGREASVARAVVEGFPGEVAGYRWVFGVQIQW